MRRRQLLFVGVVHGVSDAASLGLGAGSGVSPVGSHAVCWVDCGGRLSCGSDGFDVWERGSILSLDLRAPHRGRLLASGGRGLVYDSDGIRALALAGGAEVGETDGLLDGELARHVSDVEPLGEVVDGDKWHYGARDDVGLTIGGSLLGVRPDDEETRAGCHINGDHIKCRVCECVG